MNCYFTTFGCKVNTSETACMQAEFHKHGFKIVSDSEQADVIILNSCTVTSSGDSRSCNALKKLRHENPDAVIVLTGCFPQAFPEEAKAIPEADIVVGTKNRSEIIKLVEDFINNNNRSYKHIEEYTGEEKFEVMSNPEFSGNTRAFIKIQDGCNSFCTYCIIPYARGRCRSKPLSVLKTELCEMSSKEYHEIVLCGINLAFYGMEWKGSLIDAILLACDTEGIERVRLGSLEPERITEDMLQVLSEQPKFCRQFHLSLQSGCDRTLKAMNRRYNTNEYMEICKRIRHYMPDCAITTDLMVGFPDETDDDFKETLKFIEKVQFANIHGFRYSPRKGTKAAAMSNQVPEQIKSERMEMLKQCTKEMHIEFLKSHIGKTVSVLFERERGDGFHIGHAKDGTIVKVPMKNEKKSLRKSIFYVTIEKNDAVCCYGRIISDSNANS